MSKPKNPDRVCGWSWHDPSDPSNYCAHVCRLTVSDHGDYHYCCGAEGGTMGVYE